MFYAIFQLYSVIYCGGVSVVEWLRRLALKLLAPLCWGSNPMRGSFQLLTVGCWFTPRKNVFLQLWKLTAIYYQTWLKNGIKHQSTSPIYCGQFPQFLELIVCMGVNQQPSISNWQLPYSNHIRVGLRRFEAKRESPFVVKKQPVDTTCRYHHSSVFIMTQTNHLPTARGTRTIG